MRVWTPPDLSVSDQRLHGVVEHIADGRETTFVDDEELLAILRTPKAGAGRAGTREMGGTP